MHSAQDKMTFVEISNLYSFCSTGWWQGCEALRSEAWIEQFSGMSRNALSFFLCVSQSLSWGVDPRGVDLDHFHHLNHVYHFKSFFIIFNHFLLFQIIFYYFKSFFITLKHFYIIYLFLFDFICFYLTLFVFIWFYSLLFDIIWFYFILFVVYLR